eukprot:Blabericola_migrator_1__5964@NODE_3004_length_2122_cov_11_748905_g1879_i0_p1_GENE_NODE_3004_length_2122_cov_11_748905_g1879_i0NODE_3004_length_2122_cov_11_748905_g1879_i0_p1_ORF_typecomplete_len439_score58_67DUF5564/PF17719_1/0_036DUF5564/PF17719_1/7_6e03_NODE_3004_length_2122_cov_11_748905_g1879_i02011517
MSARYLQARKPVPSEEYKRVGLIILTTLAVNEASTLQPEGPSSCPPGSIEDVMLEAIPITEQESGSRETLVLYEDGEHSLDDGVESSQEMHSKASHALSENSVGSEELTLAESPVNPSFQLLSESEIRNNFRDAALRPLPISQGQSGGEDSRAKKSIELDVPHFLHPTNQVANPLSEAVMSVLSLHRANQPEQAVAAMRAQFSEGEFEKHLISTLRQQMFDLGEVNPYVRNSQPGPLVRWYTEELQRWCASVFDATVRRVQFMIDSASRLVRINPTTGEIKFHPEVEANCKHLKRAILEARNLLGLYLQAEPQLTRAVNQIKNGFTKKHLLKWRAYKTKHSLTSSTVKTRKLEQPLRSMTYLSKATHFISWYLRHTATAFFLFDRRRLIKAIQVIEGKSSMLAKVLENLCVQDLAAFADNREKLEREEFHSYIKVPQE